ncbi:MAG: hypothetical protein KDK40_05530 [Chlamydiia bacterium]|nr:hypothetical protein [Chlamydiia bacterium]
MTTSIQSRRLDDIWIFSVEENIAMSLRLFREGFVLCLLGTALAGTSGLAAASPNPTPCSNERQYQVCTPFTGKVLRNKVRIRLRPDIDSPIVREVNKGELISVIGGIEGFYAVKPLRGSKLYAYRAYVLDQTVEASHVNARLEPTLESPVVCQLNQGDKIEGKIAEANKKWIEFAPPQDVVFYISKDYVEQVGDAAMIERLEKRQQEVAELITQAAKDSQTQLAKTFPSIQIEEAVEKLNRVHNEYADFPEQNKRASALLAQIKESYLQKKIAFLEQQASNSQNEFRQKCDSLTEKVTREQEHLARLERDLESAIASEREFEAIVENEETIIAETRQPAGITRDGFKPERESYWQARERSEFESWLKQNPGKSQDEFYEEGRAHAEPLKGILRPYARKVKNKPGEYLIVDEVKNAPIACVYSTTVDLSRHVGDRIVAFGVLRPNNHFAFPAYMIREVE